MPAPCGCVVEPAEELTDLHRALMDALRPFERTGATSAAFSGGDPRAGDLKWVAAFRGRIELQPVHAAHHARACGGGAARGSGRVHRGERGAVSPRALLRLSRGHRIVDTRVTMTLTPASTAVLLRDGTEGLEVFLVRRHGDSAFMGGAHVFPGGRVDDADRMSGEVSARVGVAPARIADVDQAAALAFYIAAVRETSEEVGVRLAIESLSTSPGG